MKSLNQEDKIDAAARAISEMVNLSRSTSGAAQAWTSGKDPLANEIDAMANAIAGMLNSLRSK